MVVDEVSADEPPLGVVACVLGSVVLVVGTVVVGTVVVAPGAPHVSGRVVLVVEGTVVEAFDAGGPDGGVASDADPSTDEETVVVVVVVVVAVVEVVLDEVVVEVVVEVGVEVVGEVGVGDGSPSHVPSLMGGIDASACTNGASATAPKVAAIARALRRAGFMDTSGSQVNEPPSSWHAARRRTPQNVRADW